MSEVRSKAISATRWAFGAELLGRTLSPLVFLALAAFLAPAEFGVASAAALVLSFSQTFWSLGLGRALIQTDEDVDAVANFVFWTNLGLALVIYLLLFLSADWIAGAFFNDERVGTVVRVQGIALLLGALSSVHSSLLERELNFRATFWIKLSTLALPGACSIPLAAFGFSYWSLVAGALAGAAGQAVVLWRFSAWRPKLGIDRVVARKTMRFGAWVSVSALLGWFYTWMDSLIVGRYFGVADMGIYRAGAALVGVVFAVLISPAIPVLYSALSRIKSDDHSFRRGHQLVVKALAVLSLSAGVGLGLLHREIGATLFAERWGGVERVIAFLGVFQGISWIWAANAEAYRAKGHADVETKFMLLGVCYYLPVYLLTAPLGLNAFLWGRLLVVAGGFAVQAYFMPRYLNLTIGEFGRLVLPSAGIVAGMAVVVAGCRGVLAGHVPPAAVMVICIAVAVPLVAWLVWVFEREVFAKVFNPALMGLFRKAGERA